MEAAAHQIVSRFAEDVRTQVERDLIPEAVESLMRFVDSFARQHRNQAIKISQRHRRSVIDKISGSLPRDNWLQEHSALTDDILDLVALVEQDATVKPEYQIAPYAEQSHIQSNRPSFRANNTMIDQNCPGGNPDFPQHPSSKPHSTIPTDQSTPIVDLQRNYWASFRFQRPPQQKTAVHCDRITKRFRGSEFCLTPISFNLEAGQITAIVGRNASGKTTLLQLVNGETAPDSGTISYPGLMRAGPKWTDIKSQIRYIPQFPTAWSGRLKSNLHFIAAACGVKGADNQTEVDWYTELFELHKYEAASWKTLSGGYRLRYELAKALVAAPKLLVLDEPLASLDIISKEKFLKFLQGAAHNQDAPIPIILTSQDLYDVDAVADQVIILEEGKCLFQGPLEKIEEEADARIFDVQVLRHKRELEIGARPQGFEIIELTSDGFLIETTKNVSFLEISTKLNEVFGQNLIGIRDITGSSRKYFVDKIVRARKSGN